MNNRGKNESRKESFMSNLGTVTLLIFGIFMICGFFIIDTSQEINHYYNLAADNPSGFRFIVFFEIFKYGILVVGLLLVIITFVKLVKQIINKKSFFLF